MRIFHTVIVAGLLSGALTAQAEDLNPLGNVPITFYGKVVDENNQPVEGVHVHAEILYGYWISPTEGGQRLKRVSISTDARGNFTLQSIEGTSVRLNEIEKKGYKLSPKIGKPTYLYYPVKIHPAPQKPEMFRMWKERGSEPLIQPRSWNGNVPCDGTTNRFDLLHGRRRTDGDLEISCTRTPLNRIPREGKKFDYAFEIAVRGGTIQLTHDEFTYLAPESGYASRFIEKKKAGEKGWRGRFTQEFYFRTAEGHYGRISVDWYASQTNPTHLDWNCSINPSGSRNLER